MKKKWLEVLSRCRLFHGLDPAGLEAVFGCLQPDVRTYSRNDWVTMEGTPFNGVGVVLAGSVTVAKENAAGNRVIMTVCEPGEIFGEMTAFSGKEIWPVSVSARVNSTVMFLPAGKIVGSCANACDNHRQMIVNMLNTVTERALNLNRKVEYLTIKGIEGKVSAFLLEQHKATGNTTFMMPLKRHELAEFLNVARPSLSRELSRLRDQGVIEFHRDSVRIKKLEYLQGVVLST